MLRKALAIALTMAATLGMLGWSAAGPAAARTVQPVRSGASSTPTHHRDVPRLSHRGRFLTDPSGRVVILHGINLVYKHAPYIAPNTARGFTARDARFMARHGINAVRLGVLFEGVMPKPGHIDQRYLDRVERVVRLLADRHLWVLLDFHQDAFSQQFDGEGFPAWAVHDDGLPFTNLGSFFLNDQTPAVETTYDHFWDNDDRLWHYYDQAWQAVARRWADQPYLMGYDLFNEPNPGTKMTTCANPAGCPAFDATMERMYNTARRAIRSVDRHNIVWFEPQFLFNALSASNFTRVDDPEVGLSWHDYACTPAFVSGGVIPGDPDCTVNEPRVMNNAATQAKTMGAASLMTEFGAEDDLTDLQRLTADADQHLDGWMYWAYKTWNDPTGNADEGLFANDAKLSSVKRAKLDDLYHPYAQAIAGTPLAMAWNSTSETFTVSYRPRPSTGLTAVFVPAGFYRHGAKVEVTGGRVRRHHDGHFEVAAGAHARTVTVTVRPRR